MRRKIAVDMGTNNTVIWSDGSIVVNEPTIVALSADTEKIVAVGKEALSMLGKTPETVVQEKPVVGGVIANFSVAKAYLRIEFAKLSKSFELLRPDVMLTVPSGSTSVEKRAALEMALESGASHAYIVDATLAAAIGAGVAVSSPSGNVVLHVGADVTEAAVLSLGGIVAFQSRRVGGNTINTHIKSFLRKEYGLIVGDVTCEEIKRKLVSATVLTDHREMEISGRDLTFGMPRNITLKDTVLHEVTAPVFEEIVSVLEIALGDTPAELSSDVIDKGIVLTGGGSYITHFDRYITNTTGIPAHLAEDPELCAVRGAAVVLENLNLWKRSIITKA